MEKGLKGFVGIGSVPCDSGTVFFPNAAIEAALAAPRPAKVEATRGDVMIGGPICRYMFT